MAENTGFHRRHSDSKPPVATDLVVPTARERCAHCEGHFDLGDEIRTQYERGIGFLHYHAGCAWIAGVPVEAVTDPRHVPPGWLALLGF